MNMDVGYSNTHTPCFCNAYKCAFMVPGKKTQKITPVKKSSVAARGWVLGVKRCVEVSQSFTDVVEKQFYLLTVAFKCSAERRSCSAATPTIGSQTLWLGRKQAASIFHPILTHFSAKFCLNNLVPLGKLVGWGLFFFGVLVNREYEMTQKGSLLVDKM